MSDCLCDKCAALCCRYFALPIDNPETRRDFDNVRWYLLHDKVVIFVENKQWYMGVLSRCKALRSDNLCGIYETRPAICRSYSTDNCDYHAGDYGYDLLFTSADALWKYANEELKKRRAKSKAKSQRKVKRAAGKGNGQRPVKRANRARQLARKLPIPAEPKSASSGPITNGNGHRSIALPTLRV